MNQALIFLLLSSVPGMVAQEMLEGRIIPVLSDEILQEYRQVLIRKKFRFDPTAVEVYWTESAAEVSF